jgi:signal transduction histidine kinase
LRLRLTLLYSAILALALIVFSAVIYVVTSRVTERVTQEAITTEASRIVQDRKFGLTHFTVPSNSSGVPYIYLVQTRDVNGDLLARSWGYSEVELPLTADTLDMALDGHIVFTRMKIDELSLMVYNGPIYDKETRVLLGLLQVARPVSDQDDALGVLGTLLVGGTGLSVVIAFGVGWLLSGLTLRPIGRITRSAAAIGSTRDFSQRVAYKGPRDELGTLAATLNQMLAELQSAYDQTEQTLTSQRRFVADASHELRTPLTTIRGNLGLLQRVPAIDEEDQRAVLRDAIDESERLIRLVNQLLSLARADAGAPVTVTPLDIKPILEAAARQALLLAPGRPITHALFEPLQVQANRDSLQQILLILLDNARSHTPPGTAIHLGLEARETDALVTVRDSGPGIPPDKLTHIFDRFFRGSETRTGSGAGLGLAIAKSLAEAQGGGLMVDSQAGVGTTFTLTVPRATSLKERLNGG